MAKARNSISHVLTVTNLLVSGAGIVLACAAFFAYEAISFRQTLIDDVSIQGQIIAANAASALIFNDAQSAETTLSALHAAPNIVYGGIYDPSGQFFAGYWRDPAASGSVPAITPTSTEQRQFTWREFVLAQPIFLGGKLIGFVYIRSDLSALTNRLETYLAILLVILGASLLTALLASRIAQRGISRPMIALAETARTVSRGKNYAVRAAAAGDYEEVNILVDAFNEMLTAIHQRDTTLQESEAQFRTLADSLPQLAWMADPDGSIIWYNQRWYDYTGTTFEQVAGWGWESVHDPHTLPEVLNNWSASIRLGKRFEMVFPLLGRDGVYRDFLTLAIPVRGPEGKIARWFGTNTDITEQRRSEEALRRSEKLAATGRLAASIAHEINNPLEAVTNLLYLARKQPAKSETYLTMADEELDRIAEITRHTLGFYRDSSTPVRLDLSKIAHEVLALYERKLQFKNTTVTEEYDNSAEIEGFPGEIRQIFANLVVNAIDAMNEGGHLTVRISRSRRWSDDTPSVRISIMDTGSGIEPKQMKMIFHPFYTTKQDVGTGLGLWLTQSLVKKHEGTIGVRSRTDSANSGTVFSILLPQAFAGGGNAQGEKPLDRRAASR